MNPLIFQVQKPLALLLADRTNKRTEQAKWTHRRQKRANEENPTTTHPRSTTRQVERMSEENPTLTHLRKTTETLKHLTVDLVSHSAPLSFNNYVNTMQTNFNKRPTALFLHQIPSLYSLTSRGRVNYLHFNISSSELPRY
jgi:hypothetical protein